MTTPSITIINNGGTVNISSRNGLQSIRDVCADVHTMLDPIGAMAKKSSMEEEPVEDALAEDNGTGIVGGRPASAEAEVNDEKAAAMSKFERNAWTKAEKAEDNGKAREADVWRRLARAERRLTKHQVENGKLNLNKKQITNATIDAFAADKMEHGESKIVTIGNLETWCSVHVDPGLEDYLLTNSGRAYVREHVAGMSIADWILDPSLPQVAFSDKAKRRLISGGSVLVHVGTVQSGEYRLQTKQEKAHLTRLQPHIKRSYVSAVDDIVKIVQGRMV
jgi:hypothetical protein